MVDYQVVLGIDNREQWLTISDRIITDKTFTLEVIVWIIDNNYYDLSMRFISLTMLEKNDDQWCSRYDVYRSYSNYEHPDYFLVFYLKSKQWKNDVLVCPIRLSRSLISEHVVRTLPWSVTFHSVYFFWNFKLLFHCLLPSQEKVAVVFGLLNQTIDDGERSESLTDLITTNWYW